jgi:hypothetical protein
MDLLSTACAEVQEGGMAEEAAGEEGMAEAGTVVLPEYTG